MQRAEDGEESLCRDAAHFAPTMATEDSLWDDLPVHDNPSLLMELISKMDRCLRFIGCCFLRSSTIALSFLVENNEFVVLQFRLVHGDD